VHGHRTGPPFVDGRLQRFLSSEAELNTSLVAKVALIVVAGRQAVAKAVQEIVKLCRSDREVLAQRNVDASADDEIKRIVARRFVSVRL
jgi:hypothetical protein